MGRVKYAYLGTASEWHTLKTCASGEDLPVEFFLAELSEYDMKVKARCWVDSEVYWPVYWEQLEAVKKALDAHGVEIPIPRREIFQGEEKVKKSDG